MATNDEKKIEKSELFTGGFGGLYNEMDKRKSKKLFPDMDDLLDTKKED
jgi:hypothetical protein